MQEGDPEPGSGGNEGPIILLVGILGLFMQALGPVAWVWGNKALKRAKPSEAGLIQAGRILGIIDTILIVFVLIIFIGYYMIWIKWARMFNDITGPPSPPTPPAAHAPKPANPPKLPVKVQMPADAGAQD